ICHANLQIVLETFSHAQPASKYSLSNGAETALTMQLDPNRSLRQGGRTEVLRESAGPSENGGDRGRDGEEVLCRM
ncbi:hypothetical protein CN210_24925, partial [Sinorhizobium meliloti]